MVESPGAAVPHTGYVEITMQGFSNLLANWLYNGPGALSTALLNGRPASEAPPEAPFAHRPHGTFAGARRAGRGRRSRRAPSAGTLGGSVASKGYAGAREDRTSGSGSGNVRSRWRLSR